MVMDTLQIRLNSALVKKVDSLVEDGYYSSRSELVRDAVRRFVWVNELGTISLSGKSVQQVRKARTKLSKQSIDLDDVNSL